MRYLRSPRKPLCTIHEVIECGIYPYRCSKCGRCFICGHIRVGYRWWLCLHPLGLARTRFSPGVPHVTDYLSG